MLQFLSEILKVSDFSEPSGLNWVLFLTGNFFDLTKLKNKSLIPIDPKLCWMIC
jgi:hypothetical protein